MNDKELSELKALAEAATPGPTLTRDVGGLTDEQILAALGSITHEVPKRLPLGWLKFARAIEREVLATKEADLEDPAELMKRWPTAQAFIDAHPEEYFESNEPVPRLHLAYAVDLLTDALAGEAVEPVQVEVRNAEPVAWGLLSIQEPELTNSAELAAYWSRKGRVVTPLYAAPTAGVSIVEWLNSIDADGYRTDQERMAARILAKIAPSAALATSPAPSVKQEANDSAIRAAAQKVIGFRDGALPTRGWLPDNDRTRAALQELADALAAPSASQGEVSRLREIARLIGSIFVYGDFKAETHAERALEKLLREQGTFFESVAEYEASLAAAPAPSVMDEEEK